MWLTLAPFPTIVRQISCESDAYVAFEVLGTIGVLSVPIGIPSLSLFFLFKNRAGIRRGSGMLLLHHTIIMWASNLASGIILIPGARRRPEL
jgi:hypothetical protein